MAKKIRIQLIKSTVSQIPKHRGTVRALGLSKINSSVILEKTDSVMGMVNRVSHLVKVEEV